VAARRYILRFLGQGEVPPADVARIERESRVLDRSPRMLLVESSGPQLARLVETLPRWVAAEEHTVPVPNARPRVRRLA
jgi:hypothetical protein